MVKVVIMEGVVNRVLDIHTILQQQQHHFVIVQQQQQPKNPNQKQQQKKKYHIQYRIQQRNVMPQQQINIPQIIVNY